MNTSLWAVTLAVACASYAHAQSNVTIDGAPDAGLIKRTGTSLAIGQRDPSEPPDPADNAFNRIANAEAHGCPQIAWGGSAIAPRYRANSTASANPYSISATCPCGAVGALPGVERNGIESELWSVAASIKPATGFRPMAINESTKAWVLGAHYTVARGTVLPGYAHKTPEGVTRSEQLSIGYEHALSKRSYLYADASQKKITTTVNHADLGMGAAF